MWQIDSTDDVESPTRCRYYNYYYKWHDGTRHLGHCGKIRDLAENVSNFKRKKCIIICINIKKRYENDCPHSNDYHFSFIFIFNTEQWFVILFIYPKILDYQVFETNEAFYYLFDVFRSGAPSYIWCCSVVDHARSI